MSEVLVHPSSDLLRGVIFDVVAQKFRGEAWCTCGEWYAFEFSHSDKISDFVPDPHGYHRIPNGLFDEVRRMTK